MEKEINNPNFKIMKVMLENMPKPSIFEYIKIRIGMKLYKWKIIKGWDFDPINNKTHFYFK